MKITKIFARQIIDSRDNPTVEAEVEIDNKYTGRASVPSGASTGTYEALELRDGDLSNYLGQSVLHAVDNVNTKISSLLIEKENLSQKQLDDLMRELDGTENKSNLGANAILSVSLAYAWAISKARNLQLFEYIGELYGNTNFIMPRPMFNIMNGGKHGNWATDIQEYVIMPLKTKSWSETLQIGCNVYDTLRDILKQKGLSINVGDEGGFAPLVKSNIESVDLIIESCNKAGYKFGEEIGIGFDMAASEFYNAATNKYDLKRDGKTLTSDDMVEWLIKLSEYCPITSFEDALSQEDWSGWKKLTNALGLNIQIVGDDLLVTNVKRISRAIQEKSCNALLVKVNQIGTLTEALDAMKMSSDAGWKNIVSHRSGETEDVTIAHIVVGTGCGQIKAGAPTRGERIAKYNELIRIEEFLNK